MRPRSSATSRTRRGPKLDRLVLGVFLLFAPIGCMLALLNGWPPGGAVAVAIFGGFISVGWMLTFQYRLWWLILPLILVPMPFVAGPLFFRPLATTGLMSVGAGLDPYVQRLLIMILAITSLAAGFTLIVTFIRRTESVAGKMRAELDLGQRIHQRLVTPIEKRTPRMEIVGRSDASAEMGGDLLDLITHDGRIDLLVGDVSGHGVAAGVVMAMVRGAVRSRLHAEAPGSLVDLMHDLSRTVADSNAPEMFATMAAIRVRENERSIEIALAGHNPVFWHRRASGMLEDIDNESLPLGVAPDERYTSRAITPDPGDWLVLYTDGLFEVTDGAGRQLGVRGFRAIVEETIRSATDITAAADAILARVHAHGPIADDQTIALIRFVG